MPDTQSTPTKRDLALERMKGKYPDKDFADDEALFGQINEDYDAYDQRLSDYEAREKSFSDLFTSDPRSAKFLNDWRSGKNPAIALVEMFGEDFVEELKDPAKQEEVAAASKAFAERVAQEKDYEEQYNKNIAETRSMVEQLQKEEGLSDDDIDAAMEFLIGIMRDGLLGKFSPDSVHMALKAIHHDDDVEVAAREGEVKGRNAKIDEKLRRGKRSDGTATLDGKNGTGGTPRTAPELGALGQLGSSNIWERGGEKRRSYK